MLSFYYDLVDRYVDRKDFCILEMDTGKFVRIHVCTVCIFISMVTIFLNTFTSPDSLYMALSAGNLEDVVKPHLQREFVHVKEQWFPRTDTRENAAYNKRTPGLFKEEWRGDGCVALNSKTYYCFGETDKFSSKGVNKSNVIEKDMFLDVLRSRRTKAFTNRGIISKDNDVYTYEMVRNGLSFFYGKRKVLNDAVSTEPLDI